MKPPINYYDVLGLQDSATTRQIRAAFRQAVFEHHPDRHNNASHAQEKTILLNEAYDVLSDPNRRVEHDRRLRRYDSWAHSPQVRPACHRQGAMAPRPPAQVQAPRRPWAFGSFVLSAWVLLELYLFIVDRLLPRLGNGEPPPNWFWDAFSGAFLAPPLAVVEGDAAFITNTLSAAVGFLTFLLTSAFFRLVSRSSAS